MLDANTWNEQYSKGLWDRLQCVEEVGHYALIAGLINYYKKQSNVLEIGSGEGILADHILYYNYTGLDLSSKAVNIGKEKRGDANTKFVVGDMFTWIPDTKFSTIVFNECLRYADSEHESRIVVERFLPFLEPDGLIIISNYKTASGLVPDCVKIITKFYVTNSGHTWEVLGLQKG